MDSIQIGLNKNQWQPLVNVEIYVCQSAEENVHNLKGWNNRGLEKTVSC
jgi:hypothetical protein